MISSGILQREPSLDVLNDRLERSSYRYELIVRDSSGP
jgi:hypothetical protein